MTERTIEIINKEQADLSFEMKTFRNNLEKEFDKIRTIFSDCSLATYIYANPQSSISIILKSYEFDLSIDFNYKLINEFQDVEMTENIKYYKSLVQEKNSKENNNTLIKFSKILSEVAECKDNLTENILFDLLVFVKDYNSKINKINKKIQILNNEEGLLNKMSKIEQVNKVFISIGNFCVDSFLCKKLGIEIKDEKPNREEIKRMKLKIKDSITYRILIKSFDKKNINIGEFNIYLYSGEYNFYYKNKKVKTKKEANNILSDQFTYKDELIGVENGNFIKEIPFFCDENRLKNPFKTKFEVSCEIDLFLEDENVKKYFLYENIKSF